MDYVLRDIVELTGFSKQVLNAWERRYELGKKSRGSDGGRIYDADDVHRLQMIRKCMDNGARIGQLAKLDLTELRSLAGQSRLSSNLPLGALLSAVKSLDAKSVETQLSVHFATLGPVSFAEDIVVPLMTQIGQLWRDGEMTVAAEHCATAIVRTLLGQGLRLTEPKSSKSLALFTTVEDEPHELGALTAGILAQSCGVRSLYLGASLPCDSLASTCQSLNASVVGLSANLQPSVKLRTVLEDLYSRVPADVEIWLGGDGFCELKDTFDRRTSFFDNVPDYIAAVERHSVRLARLAKR